MIKLKVESYCQECAWFNPETIKSFDMRQIRGRKMGLTETAVVCKERDRCAILAETIKEQLMEEKR